MQEEEDLRAVVAFRKSRYALFLVLLHIHGIVIDFLLLLHWICLAVPFQYSTLIFT